eukprot:480449-Hanusia_phi.AAC.2
MQRQKEEAEEKLRRSQDLNTRVAEREGKGEGEQREGGRRRKVRKDQAEETIRAQAREIDNLKHSIQLDQQNKEAPLLLRVTEQAEGKMADHLRRSVSLKKLFATRHAVSSSSSPPPLLLLSFLVLVALL